MKPKEYNAQLHLYVTTKTVKDLDDIADKDNSNRSRIVRELVEKAWHEKFDEMYAKLQEEA